MIPLRTTIFLEDLMIKLLIHAFSGAMGQNVYQLTKDYPEFEIYGFDMIIDFSHHSLIPNLLDYASESHTPLVLYTTGLSVETSKKYSNLKIIFLYFNLAICHLE